MTIGAAITAYAQFARFVFSEKKGKGKEGTFKSSRLEQAIVKIIMEQLKINETAARNLPLFDQAGPKWSVHRSQGLRLCRKLTESIASFVPLLHNTLDFRLSSVHGSNRNGQPIIVLLWI